MSATRPAPGSLCSGCPACPVRGSADTKAQAQPRPGLNHGLELTNKDRPAGAAGLQTSAREPAPLPVPPGTTHRHACGRSRVHCRLHARRQLVPRVHQRAVLQRVASRRVSIKAAAPLPAGCAAGRPRACRFWQAPTRHLGKPARATLERMRPRRPDYAQARGLTTSVQMSSMRRSPLATSAAAGGSSKPCAAARAASARACGSAGQRR